jgi:hypothetical protein
MILAACGGAEGASPGWSQASISIDDGWVTDVHADRYGDVWAVGGRPGAGAAARYDGSGWTDVLFPGEIPLLNAVHSFPDGTTLVAGDGGTILRWEGDAWSQASTPTGEDLRAIWGTTPDDVWAVGGSADNEGEAVIVRYRNGQWESVDWPRSTYPDVQAFHAVWGTGPDDVLIGGQEGALLAWNGEALESQMVDTERDLRGLGGHGPGRVVGVGGTSEGVVVWRTENGWQSTRLDGYPGVNDVWMADSHQGWIVGRQGLVGRLQFDGDEPLFERVSAPTSMTLSALSGAAGPGLFAVGGTFENPQGPYRGVLLRRSIETQ